MAITQTTLLHGWVRVLFLMTLVFMFFCATTYPYTFQTNQLELADGIANFEKSGLLVWRGQSTSWETKRLQVLLRVSSHNQNQEGPARIFTISEDHYNSNFTIGQVNSDLIIRLRRADSTADGEPKFVVPKLFTSLNAKWIEVSVSHETLVVKVDRGTVLSVSLGSNPFVFWDANYLVALGNEHTWERPWLGKIHAAQLTIDSQTFNILSDGTASLPGVTHLLRQRLMGISSSMVDMIMNFTAMLPFGALTALICRRHPILYSVVLWLVASATVEVLQALIPGRTPTVSDVFLNASGAGLGAWLLVRFARWRRLQQVA